ncbi:hypothetical protein [Maritimibacter fusiformis]|uniref:Uncharacterized protein n=1 Tax=Maritimibacter fusiformis TaxID=2603819 RepID=A0A5D0RQB5_9RHOB|nr:hypothetical protein [Maritimibacter fusiformis]TYB82858.1 hypothetical protein FVF75_01350 [Maritimibacter fusiformis]
MAKLNKDSLFKAAKPSSETLMDKTTRVVREIRDTEAEERQDKTSRLRKTRLERDAALRADAPAPSPKKKRK